MRAEVFLGTQGWKVGAWVGPFYPRGTKSARMLGVYARAFPTVEVGSTSFAIPAEPVVRGWCEDVPPGFVFALKVPQQVTHERRLVDAERILRRFLDRAGLLGDRLGPLLLQLSPAFYPSHENHVVLENFVATLPEGFRWAIEFRHAGWIVGETLDLLRARKVATVLADGRWIRREMMTELALEPTADFAYLRWEGTGRKLQDLSRPQIERDRELEVWTGVVRRLGERVGTIYCYFDNQFQGHAPHSAREFQERLGQSPVSPEALKEQAELF